MNIYGFDMPNKSANKKNGPRIRKEQALTAVLEAAWYMPDEDKKYWTENIKNLPEPVLEQAMRTIKAKNRKVDKYISAALANDKDHRLMAELKDKVLLLKQKAFSIDESSEKGKAEDELSKDLNKIDD